MADEQCKTCRFWHLEEPPSEGSVGIGDCRRHAPRMLLAQVPALHEAYSSIRDAPAEPEDLADSARTALWPQTRDWDWCGDWQGGGVGWDV